MIRRFAKVLPVCEKRPMDPRKIFHWLIALIVAAGLVVAPLSAPAMAAPESMAATDDMPSMSEGMPCCPNQQDHKAKGCESCPLAALCMLTITLPVPEASDGLVDRNFSRRVFALPDDLLIDGLGEHPPDQPPRTIV